MTDWNLSEVKRLDIKVRKMMTTHSMHHPKADIHRLYVPRSNKGRGLSQLELSYKSSMIGLFRYLNLSDDWMLQLALKHEKEKVSHSVVNKAREFAREMNLDLEIEFDGEMKNTENARKLKRIAKEKGKKTTGTAWKPKPLHGQYTLRSQKAYVNLYETQQWLRNTGLKAETEGFVVAVQDQSLSTRKLLANISHNEADPRCRFCYTSTETIETVLDKIYTWKICNHYDIETPNKWYEHEPLPVVDISKVTILWDFPIRTDRTIQANRPDIFQEIYPLLNFKKYC